MNAQDKLDKIKQILHNESKETTEDGNTYTLCNDAYYELDGALYDIEHRTINTDISMGLTNPDDVYKIDKICIDTIKRVQQQIADVMKILDEPEDKEGKQNAV